MSGPDVGRAATSGVFSDRTQAGRALGAALVRRRAEKPVSGAQAVLGLARGGVPVAAEVASALRAPLDVCVVRKLGVPAQPEFAFGAIAENEATFVDEATVAALHLSPRTIDAVVRRAAAELAQRVRRYRGDRPLVDVRDCHVVLVDDGLATGATMRAAIRLVRQRGAASVTVAVPVGAPESVEELTKEADVVCVNTPADFVAVGAWYADFTAPTDDEVRALLG
jgi:predicted phosphoribosyltransferase